jgi:transcriptional regulator of acetoin/glycerol metabolism
MVREHIPAGVSSVPARIFNQKRGDMDRAWEQFLGGAARDTLSVRSPILESWERCRASSVDLGTTFAPLRTRDVLEARRHEHQSLIKAAAETLADAVDILVGTDTIMLVTDPDGLVLEGVGDRAALRAGADIALARGGHWREDAAGTNGIGVAVKTMKPTLVHAGEHYCERMKSWSCAAAPIVDPCDGGIAGILNLSARSQFAQSQIFGLAMLGARRIEQALLHQADVLRARLLEAALGQGRDDRTDGLIALDGRGRIAFASRRAAALLRERLDIRLGEMTPGHRVFNMTGRTAHGSLPELAAVPSDWVSPIRIDGEIGGYMLVIPAESRVSSRDHRPARVPAQARRYGDEGDRTRDGFAAIIGSSDTLAAAKVRARAFAPSRLPVLIEGETGVGKELFARAVHGKSGREGPFIALNCGAISRDLIASELFGYVKGAFTGAGAEGRAGRFELADGGTLCLDEVGELPLDLQPYLLRVLEEGVLSRIGEAKVRAVSVRIVAMTNRDLEAEVAAGRFRRDLYHRLAVATVTVPPLRERAGDLDQLIEHFRSDIARQHGTVPPSFSAEALACIHAHNWPGNVRELRNALETATLLAQAGIAGRDCLPRALLASGPARGSDDPTDADERRRVVDAIAMTAGNMSAACAVLHMSRSTLYRRMDQYQLDRSQLKEARLNDLRSS